MQVNFTNGVIEKISQKLHGGEPDGANSEQWNNF